VVLLLLCLSSSDGDGDGLGTSQFLLFRPAIDYRLTSFHRSMLVQRSAALRAP
jgi:hypothetical protein